MKCFLHSCLFRPLVALLCSYQPFFEHRYFLWKKHGFHLNRPQWGKTRNYPLQQYLFVKKLNYWFAGVAANICDDSRPWHLLRGRIRPRRREASNKSASPHSFKTTLIYQLLCFWPTLFAMTRNLLPFEMIHSVCKKWKMLFLPSLQKVSYTIQQTV